MQLLKTLLLVMAVLIGPGANAAMPAATDAVMAPGQAHACCTADDSAGKAHHPCPACGPVMVSGEFACVRDIVPASSEAIRRNAAISRMVKVPFPPPRLTRSPCRGDLLVPLDQTVFRRI